MQEKESIISERYGSTNLSLGSLFGITRQSLVMPNSDPWDRFVDPYLTLMTDSYSNSAKNNKQLIIWSTVKVDRYGDVHLMAVVLTT